MSQAPDSCCPGLQASLSVEMFRSLADPVRLQVLVRLAQSAEPMMVSEVTNCCGVHLSGVSRHLKILREAGVVEAEKVGREVHYRLARRDLIQRLRGIADSLEVRSGEKTDDTAPA